MKLISLCLIYPFQWVITTEHEHVSNAILVNDNHAIAMYKPTKCHKIRTYLACRCDRDVTMLSDFHTVWCLWWSDHVPFLNVVNRCSTTIILCPFTVRLRFHLTYNVTNVHAYGKVGFVTIAANSFQLVAVDLIKRCVTKGRPCAQQSSFCGCWINCSFYVVHTISWYGTVQNIASQNWIRH